MKRLLILFIFLAAYLPSAYAINKPATADEAFRLSAMAHDSQTVVVNWKIKKDYYLYRSHLHFKVADPKTAQIAQPLMPNSSTKDIPGVGKFQVYQGNLNIALPIINPPKNNLVLVVSYQGCSKDGFCYPPLKKVLSVNMSTPLVTVTPLNIDVPVTATKHTQPSQQQDVISLLKKGKLFWLILGFLGFGILLSLTPCVLPMVPILSTLIIGQKKITHKHSFTLALSYVMGMAVTYAVAGMLFGFIGGNIQVMLQKPIFIISFSLLMVALSLSMFGFYHIELPSRLRSKLHEASEHQKRGTYFGAFVMGILSSLILSPCVTPPLVAVLGYISQTGDAKIGGLALFFMAIGMGTPLLLIGAAGPKILPKTGVWMNAVKNIMGILLLAMAVYLLSRIIPWRITLALTAALNIGTAIYFGAFSTSQNKAQMIAKTFGILFFINGILLSTSAFLGNSNPYALFSATQTAQQQLNFIPVKTITDVNQQILQAKKLGKPVMLDFYADWCISCKEMDHFTFANPLVANKLKDFVTLRADITANDAEDKALMQKYGVVAPPTILFFNKQGQENKTARIVGEMSAGKFLAHLKELISN